MEKIEVYINWCRHNYSGSYSENVPGGVAFTGSTYEEMLRKAHTTLDFHLQGYAEDGEAPQWFLDKDYVLEFRPSVSALLHAYGADVTLSAISRETGINQRQLSHYANGIKNPRPAQRQRIIDGIHSIGRRLMAVV